MAIIRYCFDAFNYDSSFTVQQQVDARKRSQSQNCVTNRRQPRRAKRIRYYL